MTTGGSHDCEKRTVKLSRALFARPGKWERCAGGGGFSVVFHFLRPLGVFADRSFAFFSIPPTDKNAQTSSELCAKNYIKRCEL